MAAKDRNKRLPRRRKSFVSESAFVFGKKGALQIFVHGSDRAVKDAEVLWDNLF